MNDKMKYKDSLILWDIDGTLLHSADLGAKYFRDAVAECCSLAGDPEIISFAGQTDWIIGRKYLQLYSQKKEAPIIEHEIMILLENYSRRFLSDYINANGPEAYPNALKAVQWIAEQGITQGILTGNIEQIAHAKLNRFGFSKYLKIGAFSTGESNRSEIAHAAKKLFSQQANSHCLVIGDTVNDVLAAQAIDAKCVILGHLFPEQAFSSNPPTAFLPNLVDFGAFQDTIMRLLC